MLDTTAANTLRPIAFYLPQFHPIPENDQYWGKGFTDWRNVAKARPRFSGHGQPHIPADLGYYDLRLAEVREAQANLARSAGIHGFCYYHYWFSGQRLLNRPFDEVLATGRPDFPFMLAWANENWTRAWDGGAGEVLLAQSYSDDDTRAHAAFLARAFRDPRYIRIGGRPVFAVYNIDELPDAVGWARVFRQACRDFGVDPYLIRIERYLDRDLRTAPEIGFDAGLEFQPFSRNFLKWQKRRSTHSLGHRIRRRLDRHLPVSLPSRDTIFDLTSFVSFDTAQLPGPDLVFPGVCPSWDNSARRPTGKATIFRNDSPKLFKTWVTQKVRNFRPRGEENFLFINAWNEWAEGNHLEPCVRHGHGWLDALREGLGQTHSPADSLVLDQAAPASGQP